MDDQDCSNGPLIIVLLAWALGQSRRHEGMSTEETRTEGEVGMASTPCSSVPELWVLLARVVVVVVVVTRAISLTIVARHAPYPGWIDPHSPPPHQRHGTTPPPVSGREGGREGVAPVTHVVVVNVEGKSKQSDNVTGVAEWD